MSKSELDQAERIDHINKLLLLKEETEYIIEIMDIQDELGIVNSVLGQQMDVLERMLSFYPKEAISSRPPHGSHQESDRVFHEIHHIERESKDIKEKFYLRDHDLMIENIGIVDKNITIVQDIIKHAEHVRIEV